MLEDVQALGVRGHDAVLDAVVDHLDEMAGAVGAAVQVAVLGGAAKFLAARRARTVADAGGQRLEDRIEMLHDVGLAADHHAVAALQAPDAAAGADIHIVDALCGQFLGAANVVDVVGIAAVDKNVARLQQGQQSAMVLSTTAAGTISQTARGCSSFLTKSASEAAPAAFSLTNSSRFRRAVKDDAFMAALQQPAHHVGAHPSQTDHPELHVFSFIIQVVNY